MKIINKNLKITISCVILMLCLCVGFNLHCKSIATTTSVAAQSETIAQIPYSNPLSIVANPTKYLNKKVKIKAKFDKFSVLGLDYKPAFKSSEKYITFLIKRDDVINNVVPLSEMKNFLPRKTAEKYIDLKPGDIIEYTGTVFSDALSDTWIDVDTFRVVSKTAQKK